MDKCYIFKDNTTVIKPGSNKALIQTFPELYISMKLKYNTLNKIGKLDLEVA